MVDQTIADLAPMVGFRAACAALGRARATYYRHHRQRPLPPRASRARRPQPRALSPTERAEVLGILHQERFVDQAPATIYATLLDDGRYVCSVPTMYRVLRAADEVHERRRQASHPATVKPELVASGPNHVWSWDITKLLGPEKWTYYQCAGINRHGEGDENALRRRSSDPRRPRAVRWRPRGRRRSVGRGTRRPAIEPRNDQFGAPTLLVETEGNTAGSARRAGSGPRVVEEPVHAWNLHARKPGGPVLVDPTDRRVGRPGKAEAVRLG